MEKIDEIKCVADYYDALGGIHNGEIFKKVIADFEKLTGVKVDVNQKLPYNINWYEQGEAEGIIFLSDYAYKGNYRKEAIRVLKSYNYYMKTFIKDAVKMLGNLNDPNRNSYLIHAYLNTPVIQDITFDGKDTFKIFSEEYGEFVFRLANEFCSKYDKLNEYMSTKRHKVCFANASMVMMENVDCNVIVSLLPSYFVDYYYHAYNYFKKSNEVLDLCSNMFMDKDSYDLLYEPIEVFNMTDRDAAKLFFSEVKDIESEIKVDLLKLAIYVQLQNMDEEQKKRILYSNNKFTY